MTMGWNLLARIIHGVRSETLQRRTLASEIGIPPPRCPCQSSRPGIAVFRIIARRGSPRVIGQPLEDGSVDHIAAISRLGAGIDREPSNRVRRVSASGRRTVRGSMPARRAAITPTASQ